MEKEAVFYLQEALKNISLCEEGFSCLCPDGIYGKKTTEAVKAFQRKRNLKETGQVDFPLWERIRKEDKRADFILSEPFQIVPVSKYDLPLLKGDENSLVEVLQNMLNLFLKSLCLTAAVTGKFDRQTEEALKMWQKVCRLNETGVCDKLTWNRLCTYCLLK